MLINRGKPSTYIRKAIQYNETELLEMNKNKVGHPYRYGTLFVIAAFAVKCIYKIGYRQASGVVEDYTENIGMNYKINFRTIHWRISEMKKEGIRFSIYKIRKNSIDIVFDSTSIKSTNDGEYRSTKYGKVKIWKKIHIAIDPETHKILNIEITNDDIADVKEFLPLLKPIKQSNKINAVFADGAYDSEINFEYCTKNNIKPIIPVHINSTGRSGRYRRKHIVEQLGVIKIRGKTHGKIPAKEIRRRNQKIWKKNSNYHKRSIVENSFAVFKRAFGEYTFSKNDKMKEKELLLKAVIYKFLT